MFFFPPQLFYLLLSHEHHFVIHSPLNSAKVHHMWKHHLLEVSRDTIFWALETTVHHPETKTILSGDTGPLAGEPIS